jgi:hypothetical protein
MAPPWFCADQLSDLKRLGVVKAQIAELETVLPACLLVSARHTPLQDVRGELISTKIAIKGAKSKIQRLSLQRGMTAAAFEARERVQLASHKLGRGFRFEEITKALESLEALETAVRQAITDLGDRQRRMTTAEPWPIQLIHEALVRGWGKDGKDIKTRPFPKIMSPSLSHTPTSKRSVFSQVVSICYQAASPRVENEGQERAIRAYLKLLKRQRERLGRERADEQTLDNHDGPPLGEEINTFFLPKRKVRTAARTKK